MIKTLTLLRHAKTNAAALGMHDRDRALTERGRRDAPVMGRWIAAMAGVPETALVSSAVRTKETWDLLQSELPTAQVIFAEDLYLAEAEEMLTLIREMPDGVVRLIVVGHNSGLEDLALALVGEGDEDDIAAMEAKFPTCAAAVFEFDVATWPEVGPGMGRLVHFMVPRRLADGDE